MDLRSLRSFLVLSDWLHFGKAAEHLHLSQPALSKQIQKLEGEIGAALLRRGPRGTSLTAAGQVLARDARSLVVQADDLLVRAQRAGRGEIGRLKVGFGVYCYALVPRVIARFRDRYPQIDVSLHDLPSAAQWGALRDGSLDIGFARNAHADAFAFRPVGTEGLVLAMSDSYARDHPEGSLAELRAAPFVLLHRDRSRAIFEQIIALCASYHFTPWVVQETQEFSTALALVASGGGISLLPRSAARTELTGLVFRPISSPLAEWIVGAIWRRNDVTPVIENFLTCLDLEIGGAGNSATAPYPCVWAESQGERSSPPGV